MGEEPTLPIDLPEQRDPNPKPEVKHCRFCQRALTEDDYLWHRICAECEPDTEYAA